MPLLQQLLLRSILNSLPTTLKILNFCREFNSTRINCIFEQFYFMKRPCRNASQTSIIKMRELHPIPLKTFNFNWMKIQSSPPPTIAKKIYAIVCNQLPGNHIKTSSILLSMAGQKIVLWRLLNGFHR